MQTLSLPSISFYCFFSIFVFYQQLHVKNFQGASQSFALALNISAFAGMLTGFAYLAYYGWSVAWWAPIIILVVGLIVSMCGFLIERLVGSFTLSSAGFVGWPLSAYYMFHYVPAAT